MSQLAPQPRFPTAKFDEPGKSYSGIVTYPTEDRQARKFGTNELAYWPDNTPVIQTRIILQLDGGEEVALYAQGRHVHAIRKALVEAEAPDIEVGGRLTLTFTHTEPSKGRGQPAKFYEAKYLPPAISAIGADNFDPADLG